MIGGCGDGLGYAGWLLLQARLESLESKLARETEEVPALRAVAAEKMRQGALLTREEAAVFLNTSTKKLQRMEACGRIRRCPAIEGLVRYSPREVERLASAPGKEA